MTDLQRITRQMNLLEITISEDNAYIEKWSEQNNIDPDDQWLQFLEDHDYNIKKWDFLKSKRDELKTKENN